MMSKKKLTTIIMMIMMTLAEIENYYAYCLNNNSTNWTF